MLSASQQELSACPFCQPYVSQVAGWNIDSIGCSNTLNISAASPYSKIKRKHLTQGETEIIVHSTLIHVHVKFFITRITSKTKDERVICTHNLVYSLQSTHAYLTSMKLTGSNLKSRFCSHVLSFTVMCFVSCLKMKFYNKVGINLDPHCKVIGIFD